MRNSKRILLAAVLMLFMTLGCQTAMKVINAPTMVPTFVVMSTNPPDFEGLIPTALLPTETVQVETTAPTEVIDDELPPGYLLMDDFSDLNSGWTTELSTAGEVKYSDGGYMISVQRENFLLWGVAGQDFDNVRIEVEVDYLAGGDDNQYGIICRYQDVENFYALMISSVGEFNILRRYKGGELEAISGDEDLEGTSINLGKDDSLIAAECIANKIRLIVNGELLIEVEDEKIKRGDVGLIVGTRGTEKSEIIFDNFIVKKAD